jgi:hypothetical protein
MGTLRFVEMLGIFDFRTMNSYKDKTLLTAIQQRKEAILGGP